MALCLVRSRAANPIADPSAGVPGVAEDASLEDVEGGQVDAGPVRKAVAFRCTFSVAFPDSQTESMYVLRVTHCNTNKSNKETCQKTGAHSRNSRKGHGH